MKSVLKLITVMLISTTVSFASSFSVVPPHADKPVTISFLQMSGSAELKQIDKVSGRYELTIKKVNKSIAYFSDRPNRIVGQMSMKAYLAKWTAGKDSLEKDAPNGVLSGVSRQPNQQAETIDIVMELFNPVYHAENDTFTYQVRVLSIGEKVKSNKVIKVSNATLLIDQFCLTCVHG